MDTSCCLWISERSNCSSCLFVSSDARRSSVVQGFWDSPSVVMTDDVASGLLCQPEHKADGTFGFAGTGLPKKPNADVPLALFCGPDRKVTCRRRLGRGRFGR